MVETGVSGSDRRALEWTKIFLEKKIPVTIYTSIYGKKRYSSYKGNFELIITKDFNLPFKNTFLVYLLRAIKCSSLIRTVEPRDIFYSTSDLLADSGPAFFGRFFHPKTKWLTGCHLLAPDPFVDYLGKFRIPSLKALYYFISQRIILFLAKHFASLVLVSNSLDREDLIKRGFKKDQVIVTYGAVEWDLINKVKAQKIKYDAVFVGRYHPQKGLGDLLDSWKIVCEKFPKAKMAMMGELEQLLPMIKKKKLNKNIDFIGFVDGIAKFKILKSGKIFLFPSHYESFGIVAAEAMAVGLPVVAYNLPIYKDIYPKGMIKVPIGDFKEFSQEIIKLLSNKKNINDLSKEAKENSLRFSWEKTAGDILKNLKIKND